MSAIAKTASITLITAVPGSGKTLRAVWYAEQAVKASDMVFACNINGLAVEGVTDFPDPTKWEELPPGSVLIVDEAQKFFRAGSSSKPDYIKAMEEIRHRGIRLILLTQHPALIDANIRALVGLHEHLVRENGKESAIVYRRSRVIDNVRSDKALAVEDHETWSFPKHCYDLYVSAEVHTVKRTIPSKYKRAAMLFALAAALFGVTAWKMGGVIGDDEEADAGAAGVAASQPQAGRVGSADSPKWETPLDYAKAHLPRFPSMPHTAPVFDDRPAVSAPEVFCVASSPGLDANGEWKEASHTCLTEQGTRYELDVAEARDLARNGPRYNPYKQPSGSVGVSGGAGVPPAAMAPDGAAPSPGVTISAPQVSGYGGIGAGQASSAP